MATQEERRASTRQTLLEAAVAALIDGGLAGFTTAEVVRRADSSNGALFRHFPTRADLLAATVEHIFDRLRRDYEETFESLPADKRTIPHLIERLWDVMSDPALAAVFELYTSSRTDAWMQAAIEPVVTDHVERWQQLARELVAQVVDVDDATIDQAVTLAILSMQGLAINLMAKPDPEAADQLIAGLSVLADSLLTGGPR